jgi:death-on-curing protein
MLNNPLEIQTIITIQYFYRTTMITNHPFVDGNKRTAYVLMRLMLKSNNIDIQLGQDDKYDFVIKASSGQVTFDQIKTWIKDNLK